MKNLVFPFILLFFYSCLPGQEENQTISKESKHNSRGIKLGISQQGEALIFDAKYHAILFAVDDYDDPKIPDLENPISDAEKLKDILISKYSFNAENVTLLKNPSEEDIINSFQKAKANLTSSDNLLIFYAGHGKWDGDTKEGYWLPSNTKLSNLLNTVSNRDITSYIRAIKSRHTLLISDACFSGSIFRSRSIDEPSLLLQDLYSHQSRKAMTSGILTTVPDESVFMKYLLKYLKENSKKYIPTFELFFQLQEPVHLNTI